MRADAQFALHQRFNAEASKGVSGQLGTRGLAGTMACTRGLAGTMVLLALSDDALGVIFEGLRNTLDPRVTLSLSSVCHGLWALTQELRRQLKADHEAAAAMCLRLQGASIEVGMRSCKELREAKKVFSMLPWYSKGLTTADLALLGTLGSVLPALERLALRDRAVGPNGVQRFAEGLGAGALPAVRSLQFGMHVGDAGASALAAALGRGALLRLQSLSLDEAAISDSSLVALAPALRRLPALEDLSLCCNPFGDEGLAALVPGGLMTGGLTNLEGLYLSHTQVADAGCAALTSALDSGALPSIKSRCARYGIITHVTPASAAAKAALEEALERQQRLLRSTMPVKVLQRRRCQGGVLYTVSTAL